MCIYHVLLPHTMYVILYTVYYIPYQYPYLVFRDPGHALAPCLLDDPCAEADSVVVLASYDELHSVCIYIYIYISYVCVYTYALQCRKCRCTPL